MTLRRGFTLEPGEPVVVVEDVITTGGSTREVMDAVRARGARVAGGRQPRRPQRRDASTSACRDRSLLELEVPTYAGRGLPALRRRARSPRSPARAPRADAGADVPLYRVTLAYDGTDFSGWQLQRRGGGRTVQGALEEALSAGSPGGGAGRGGGRRAHRRRRARPRAGGRVRARRASWSPTALQRALNGLLPADVRVLDAARAAAGLPPAAGAPSPSSTATCSTTGRVQLPQRRALRRPRPGPARRRPRCARRPRSTSAATTSPRSPPPAARSRPRVRTVTRSEAASRGGDPRLRGRGRRLPAQDGAQHGRRPDRRGARGARARTRSRAALAARDRRALAGARRRPAGSPSCASTTRPVRRGARIGSDRAAMSLQDLLEVVPAGTGEEDLLRAIDFDAAARATSRSSWTATGAGRSCGSKRRGRGPPRRHRLGARHGRDRRPASASRCSRSTPSRSRTGSGRASEVIDADGAAQALPAPRARHAARATTSASRSSAACEELAPRRAATSSSARDASAPRPTPACCSTSRSTTAGAPRSSTP